MGKEIVIKVKIPEISKEGLKEGIEKSKKVSRKLFKAFVSASKSFKEELIKEIKELKEVDE